MHSIPRIIKYCCIAGSSVYVNGQLLFQYDSSDFEAFAENTYKHFGIRYPKFYKMDNLSKLGFLAAELVLNGLGWESKYEQGKIGVHLQNKNSSIDTDIKYNKLLKKGIASPAIFVYSLPNIMIGEICIRHSIKGDNLLFVSEEYDIAQQHAYSYLTLDSGITDAVLSGRVDYCEKDYEAYVYAVEKSNDGSQLEFTKENLEHLYKNRKHGISEIKG
jgi:hypothetical protein